MQNHDTNFETQEEVEAAFTDLYQYYVASLNGTTLSEAIFIPKHTPLIVWEDKEQFVYDWHSFSHMWSHENFFIPPEQDIRGNFHHARTDSKQTLVNLSTEPSRIKIDLMNMNNGDTEFSAWPVGKEPTCSWVKLYEKLTYIPQLEKNIIGYMVWEVDVPTVIESFKYGKQHGNDNPLTNAFNNIIYPIIYTPPNGLGNKYSGTVTYPNTPAPFKPHIKWICNICGGDTSQVEYDYLGSGTNHLQCELNQQIPNLFALEN